MPACPHYKWIALSNTTLGVLMATINASIMLIALPDIFRGIGVNPLDPGNTGLLLWLIMGYLVVTAVLVVSFGRLGDMFGRVKMFNLGFAVFAAFSIALSLTWMHGTAAALVADRDAAPARGRRRDADGQLGRHPHRRVPAQRARAGAGAEPGGGDRGFLHRPGPRRRARTDQLALRVPGVGAVRGAGHDLVLPEAPRARGPAAGRAGLVGEPDVRRRAGRRPGRDHLRHPALRRPHDGLDEPAGDRPGRRGPGHARDLRRDRDPGRRADVPAVPVQDPPVHGRERGQPAGRRWAAAA